MQLFLFHEISQSFYHWIEDKNQLKVSQLDAGSKLIVKSRLSFKKDKQDYVKFHSNETNNSKYLFCISTAG